MISHLHLLEMVIRPALEYLDRCGHIVNSRSAQALLLGTALTESRGLYLRQLDGPALGLWQVEPVTEADIFANFLRYRQPLRCAVENVRGLNDPAPLFVHAGEVLHPLAANLHYSCIMARLVYYRAPGKIPPLLNPGAPDAMAAYWKAHYNTALGAGVAEHAAQYFEDAIELCAR